MVPSVASAQAGGARQGGLEMNRILVLALVIIVAVSVCGCGGGTATTKVGGMELPAWVSDPPDDDSDQMYAVGCRESQDMQMAVDKAEMSAREELASKIETHLSVLRKDFAQEIDLTEGSNLYAMYTSASKAITDQVLSGTTVVEQDLQKTESKWHACVLMSYSSREVDRRLVDEMKREQEMYTRFLESQAFKELEKEIEAHREYETGKN